MFDDLAFFGGQRSWDNHPEIWSKSVGFYSGRAICLGQGFQPTMGEEVRHVLATMRTEAADSIHWANGRWLLLEGSPN